MAVSNKMASPTKSSCIYIMAALQNMASDKLPLQNPKLLFSTTGMRNQHILEPVKGSRTDQEPLHPKSSL